METAKNTFTYVLRTGLTILVAGILLGGFFVAGDSVISQESIVETKTVHAESQSSDFPDCAFDESDYDTVVHFNAELYNPGNTTAVNVGSATLSPGTYTAYLHAWDGKTQHTQENERWHTVLEFQDGNNVSTHTVIGPSDDIPEGNRPTSTITTFPNQKITKTITQFKARHIQIPGETDSVWAVCAAFDKKNTAPNAQDDSATTMENTSVDIDVLQNDTDPENDSLTIDSVGNPANGTTTVSNNKITYTPDNNFTGSDSFTYTATDGDKSDTATVSVTVEEKEDETSAPGSITICKAAVNDNGDIIDGSSATGTTFSINIHTSTSTSQGTTETFETPLSLNENYLSENGEDNDAECATIQDLSLGDYYYSEESIQDSGEWGEPQYNDQFETSVKDTSNFSPYSPELFDNNSANNNQRNRDADGHIILSENRPNRTLVILNTKKQSDDTPTVQQCPFTEADGQIINLMDADKDNFIRSDQTEAKAMHSTSTTVGKGYYKVQLHSYDDHAQQHVNYPNRNQPNESWFVQFTSGNTNIATSSAISDLPVGQDVLTETVDNNLRILENINTATAYHAAYPDTSSPNSIVPVCAAVKKVSDLNQCEDGIDNDDDGKVDEEDPQCHTDGDPNDGDDSYDPNDDDESGGDNGGTTDTDPVAKDDSANTQKNTSVKIDVLANDEDADGDTLTIIGLTNPSDGSAATTSDKKVRYTPNSNFTGTDTFTYTIRDEDNATSSADVTVKVKKPSRNGGGGSGGSGGGGGSADLRIFNEDVEQGDEDGSAEVTWETNRDATSRVVYGTSSINADDDEENYGYTYSTDEVDNDTEDHSVDITDLETGLTWYFRPVSDTSYTSEEVGDEVSLSFGEVGGVKKPAPQQCNYLRDHLKRGWDNDRIEVLKLQSFLQVFEGYSDVELTGTFDQATYEAVEQFQMRYNDDVLNPWGYEDDRPTGFVYYTTKKKINEIVCNRSFGLTESEQNEIAQYRQAYTSGQFGRGGSVVQSGSKGKGGQAGVGGAGDAGGAGSTDGGEHVAGTSTATDTLAAAGAATRTPLQNTAATVYTSLNDIIEPVINFIFSLQFLFFLLGILVGIAISPYTGYDPEVQEQEHNSFS